MKEGRKGGRLLDVVTPNSGWESRELKTWTHKALYFVLEGHETPLFTASVCLCTIEDRQVGSRKRKEEA